MPPRKRNLRRIDDFHPHEVAQLRHGGNNLRGFGLAWRPDTFRWTDARAAWEAIGDDVLKVQYCWPIGKTLVDNLGNGLWEVRSRLGDRIARVIFCLEGSTMVLLHGFIKKTRKTPKHELGLAMKRRNQLRQTT